MTDNGRRERIRAAVAKNKAAASSLRDAIVHLPTRAVLTPVLNTLSDVETVFLGSREDRTPEQEAWWLGWAERWLQVAIREFQATAEQVNKYGGPAKVQTVG